MEGTIRKLTLSLFGVAAVAAGLLLVKQQKQVEPMEIASVIPPGESVPSDISLDRLRRLGM